MQISSNIIRFPAPAPLTSSRQAENQAQPEATEAKDNVVEFPAWPDDLQTTEKAQMHGQLFAAERIVSRIANALEAIPNL